MAIFFWIGTGFGADPLRKKGMLALLKEILCPYQSSDFAEFAAGEWRK